VNTIAAPPRTMAPPTRSEGTPAPRGVATTSKVFAQPGIGVTPSGVRVQRYQHTPPGRETRGIWERLRRMVFGITEPETGA
jgi:hypothetical protein